MGLFIKEWGQPLGGEGLLEAGTVLGGLSPAVFTHRSQEEAVVAPCYAGVN